MNRLRKRRDESIDGGSGRFMGRFEVMGLHELGAVVDVRKQMQREVNDLLQSSGWGGVSPSSPHGTVLDTLTSYGSYSQTQIHGETMLQ